MKREVIVLSRAKLQLYQSALWWAENRSLDQAARWLSVIETAIQGLAENAETYPLAPEWNLATFQLRLMTVGLSGKRTHRVLFEIRQERILIYAVRHFAQRTLTSEDFAE